MDFSEHQFLSAYLKYTENTETPRICHVWAALSAVSACLGRRCWYDTGIGPIWPNMYVVFSGPPGGRKSSAVKYARDLLEATTTIRFAPDDTGGQRQGLIKSMMDTGQEDEDEFEKEITDLLAKELTKDTSPETETFHSITKANGHKNGEIAQHILDKLNKVNFDVRDPHTMYICADELKSFVGENNSQMLTFLLKMFDGGSYSYELRTTSYKITDGLLGILGATTPSELATMLPPGAMDSGFTSRIVFVYASGRSRRIPNPTLDITQKPFLLTVLTNLFNNYAGAFTVTSPARALWEHLYMRGTVVNDPRFSFYCERRHTHLQKMSLCLAAARGSMSIEKEDMYLADKLLLLTEETMADALGEYGMNRESVAKHKMLEYVSRLTTPIPTDALFALMSRDMTHIAFHNCIVELHNSKKISMFNIPDLGQVIMGISQSAAHKSKQEIDTIFDLMQGKKVAK